MQFLFVQDYSVNVDLGNGCYLWEKQLSVVKFTQNY